MGKIFDPSDFDHGMIVGARQGGLSISETANKVLTEYVYCECQH